MSLPTPTIQLFGPPSVMVNHQPITRYHSQRVAALLFYLAATEGPQARAVLAAQLWDTADARQAKANLSKGLYYLPHAVKPFLVVNRATVALQAPTIAVDTRTFIHLHYNAMSPGLHPATRITALMQAADLYRGEFLQGFCIEGADRFNAWVAAERAHYRLLAAQTHRELLAYHAGRRAHLQAIRHATALLDLDRTDEATYRQLMRLLMELGQRDAAADVYHTCCQALQDLHGAAPSAETIALAANFQLTPAHH
ncbi:MAG TPA: hypothetical protein GYA08_20035 [Chloroflexi bacterium]|nr:hypothetical protein [Chloroflexota bacterium]